MRKTILVYEPDRSVQVALETTIRRDETLEGFQTHMYTYSELQRFRDYLRTHVEEVALIIMEIADHGNFHTGEELLEFVSTLNGAQKIPVFILSTVPKGYIQEDRLRSLIGHAELYLEKPLHIQELTTAIKSVV